MVEYTHLDRLSHLFKKFIIFFFIFTLHWTAVYLYSTLLDHAHYFAHYFTFITIETLTTNKNTKKKEKSRRVSKPAQRSFKSLVQEKELNIEDTWHVRKKGRRHRKIFFFLIIAMGFETQQYSECSFQC